MIISGAGLNGATAVSFGETPATTFSVVNSGEIDAVTPAHADGTVDLTVTTSGGGTSNAISYSFQFPTATSLASYSGNFCYSGSTSAALNQQVAYAVVALYDQTKPINSGTQRLHDQRPAAVSRR